MKFKKIFQKAAAVVMAAVTVFSVLPATTAFAAVGDVGTISFSHTYDGNGNAMRYNSSANINGYIAGGTGDYKYRMFVDGDTAFCLQPGVPLKTGNTLKEASSEAWNALSGSQKKAVGLALLYGYQGNRGNLSGSDDEKWLATQTLVWEFVTGCREATGSYRQTSSTVYSLHFGSHYPNSGAKKVYDQIVSLMSKHNTIPSFMSGSKDDITKELVYKDGKYSLTLTDKNGVLSEYSFASSSDAVSVAKSGNKLTLTSKKAFHGSVRITATRNGVPVVSQSAKLIAYGDPNLQDVITGVENASPVSAYLNVETPTGTIALKKTSEDGVVAGIQFTIKGEGINKTVTTDENGNITVEGLFPATYTITEQTIDRYEPQQTQTVTLIGGKTTTVNFNNTLKRGSLEVVKTSEDNLVEGVKFHLYGTSLSGLAVDEYAVTDGKGVAKFEDVLISGDTPYVLEEVDTAIRYVVPASQTAPIEWNKVTNRSFQNILKKFNVTVTKTDAETGTPQGDASLADLSVCDSKLLKKTMDENRCIIARADKKIEKVALQIINGDYPQEGITLVSHIIGLLGQRLWFYKKTKGYSNKLKINNNCIGCGKCVSICPMKNLILRNKKVVSNDRCTMCYRCISLCPQKAITLLGNEVVEQYRIEDYR